MEKEYAEFEDDDLSDEISDSAPHLITSREDFEAMMDDFLDNYELLGRKMMPVLSGDTGVDKLNTLRRALGQDERVRIGITGEASGRDEEKLLMPYEVEDKKDRWDCETILSEFSNRVWHFIVLMDLNSYILEPREPSWLDSGARQ